MVAVGEAGDQTRKSQLDDEIVALFLRAKESGEKTAVESVRAMSPAARRLLQLWDQLQVKDGVLYRIFEPTAGKGIPTLQMVIPESMKEAVLKDLHEGVLGGHLGEDKTLEKVKQHFYWPGYHNEVCEWVKTCGVCASRKTPSPKNQAALQSVKVGSPMQLVAVDILGPFPESDAGNSYILVVGDYFTRWMEAYPIPNQEAPTVAKAITNEFFFRFSPQEQLHSDQGRQFESQLVAEVCNILGISKSHTTPYHPQSDGLVERFNRTLLNMLSTTAVENPFEWEDHLRPLCMAYNMSVNPTTGYTPFYLMYGRQARMPIELVHGSPSAIQTLLQHLQTMLQISRSDLNRHMKESVNIHQTN